MSRARKNRKAKPSVRTLQLADIRYIQTRALEENPMLQRQQEQELGDDDDDTTAAATTTPQRGAKDYQLLDMLTRQPFGGKSSFDCWWCSHPFDTAKVGIVVAKDERRNTYYMFGNFCDWPCALAKNATLYKLKHNRKQRRIWMRQLYSKPPWNINVHLKPAPNPVSLKRKGGIYTLKAFRAYGYGRETMRLVMPTDQLHYNLVGLAPAFQIQERRERDLRATRHAEYKALLDKHIPKEQDGDGDVTMTDVVDPSHTSTTATAASARRKRKAQTSAATTTRKKPKLVPLVPQTPPTPSSSSLLRFLNARRGGETKS